MQFIYSKFSLIINKLSFPYCWKYEQHNSHFMITIHLIYDYLFIDIQKNICSPEGLK